MAPGSSLPARVAEIGFLDASWTQEVPRDRVGLGKRRRERRRS